MNYFIDTDIGSDVDDFIALLCALKFFSVKGITTVCGNAFLRAQMTTKILQTINQTIPVHAGEDKPLVLEKIYLYGHEGKGIVDGTEQVSSEHAVSFLDRSILEGDSLFCIAPLTNIALLLEKNKKNDVFPKKISRIYFMGGVLEENDRYIPDVLKHNIKVDPDACEKIFSSEIPLFILTTEVAKQVYFTLEELENLPDNPLFEYLKINARNYLGAAQKQKAFMYDPLTVLFAHAPELFKTKTKGNITITTSVDKKRAKEYIWKTLLSYEKSNETFNCNKAI